MSASQAHVPFEHYAPPAGAETLHPTKPLTKRQWEALRCTSQGMSNKEAAEVMGVAQGTIKNHIRQVIQRLRAKNMTHAVAIALRKHIIY